MQTLVRALSRSNPIMRSIVYSIALVTTIGATAGCGMAQTTTADPKPVNPAAPASATAAPASATAASSTETRAQVPDTRPGIAVFPLVNGGSYGKEKEDLTLLQVGMQQALMYELAQNPNLRVVDRAALRELMAEQDLGNTDRVDPATAARIGKIVGAKYVVTGGFMDLFGEFQLTGRIIDVETTEVVRSAQVQGKRDKMYGLIVDMASKVTDGVKLPALPAQVQESRKKRTVTPEAMVRHAMVLSIADDGDTERAVQLYRDLVKDFPDVEEWKAELQQLSGT